MDVLGLGSDLVLAESTERVGHHLEVLGQVGRSLQPGEGGHERGIAVGGDEPTSRIELAGVDTPCLLSTEELGVEVVQRVGDERTCDLALVVALGAVVDQGSADFDGGGRMGQVVQQ